MRVEQNNQTVELPMSTTVPEIVKKKLFPCVQFPMTDSQMYVSHLPNGVNEVDADGIPDPLVAGFGEAGRKASLGPLIYAVAYCPLTKHREMKKLGFNGSRALNPKKRHELAEKVLKQYENCIGWAFYVECPQAISTTVLKYSPSRTNIMAHVASVKLLQELVNNNLEFLSVIMDASEGQRKAHKQKLEANFPELEVNQLKRASALHPIVSVAECLAYWIRELCVKHWQWTEVGLELPRNVGTGYPVDYVTQKWLVEHQDPFFGFPSLIRFGWKSIQKMEKKRNIAWSDEGDSAADNDDDEEEEDSDNDKGIKRKKRKNKRSKKAKRVEEQIITQAAETKDDKRGNVASLLRLDRADSLFW